MDEPEPVAFSRRIEGGQVPEGRLEKDESSVNVGAEKDRRPFDRTVDMAFGRKVEHRGGTKGREHLVHGLGVGDIALDPQVAGISRKGFEIPGVPGIGQKIEVQDRSLFPLPDTQDEVRTDESGSARDQPTLQRFPPYNFYNL